VRSPWKSGASVAPLRRLWPKSHSSLPDARKGKRRAIEIGAGGQPGLFGSGKLVFVLAALCMLIAQPLPSTAAKSRTFVPVPTA
jgi:hypothetical protein